MIKYVNMVPLKTAVIDVGRFCQARCDFCYYVHSTDYKDFVDYDNLLLEADQAKDRGNTFIDLTGGEPTMMPQIENFIDYIHEKGMRVCVITNGLCREEKQMSLMQTGVDLWRFSMHGMEETHDRVSHYKGARKEQMRFIDYLTKPFHVNYVLVKETQNDLVEFAKFIRDFQVKQFNVINFLPHYEWGDPQKAIRMIADLRVVEPILNDAIDALESFGIGVNVRYYPMCRIRKDLRRTVCNDLQVMFDPWEWDYGAFPKTLEYYKAFGENISNHNEEKGDPCCRCGIHKVCGGINKAMNKATEGRMIDIVEDDVSDYPYFYRQYNIKTLLGPDKSINW